MVEVDGELVDAAGELFVEADALPDELVGSPAPRVHAVIVVTPKTTTAARDRTRPTGATRT